MSSVREKKKAIELLGSKDISPFSITTPERNQVIGWKVQNHNFKLGSLLITEINGKDTIDFVQSMPKISYVDGLSGDENIFNSLIQSRFGIKYKNVNLLLKEDGTSIIFFPLRFDGEILEVVPKTRGMPIAEGSFFTQAKEIFDANKDYKKFVKDNNLVLSCEMYGSRNPNEINYDYWKTELNMDVICALEWGRTLPYSKAISMFKNYNLPLVMKNFIIEGNVAILTEEFKKRYSEFLPDQNEIMFVSLEDLYNKLEVFYEGINNKYKEKTKLTGIIIEGSCWHVETSKETLLVKNKATSVKETHIRVSAGVPDCMIRHACRRAYEDMGLEDFKTDKGFKEMLEHLKEDLPEQLVKDFPKYEGKFRRVFNDFVANLTSIQEVREIVDKLIEDFKDDYKNKNMAPILREFAKKYPHLKPKSNIVFKILTKQV